MESSAQWNTNPKLMVDELNHIFKLSIPVIIAYLLEFAPGIVSIILVGQMDNSTVTFVDAAGFAVMFVNITALAIGFGLATALDTLCNQAHGAGQTRLLGIFFQTGILVLGAAFVPIFFLNFYSDDIFLLLHQPQDVALYAGQFVRWMLPGIPFLYVYELFKKILQAQNIVYPLVIVALVSNIFHILCGYYLVFHTSLGFLGAAVARTLCNVSFLLFLLPYLYCSGLFKPFWDGFHWKKAFRGIPSFIRLGLPGMMMLCFEWWAYEFYAIFSGWLPNAVDVIGANTVMINLVATSYMFYFGLAVATNVRVGNALGAGDELRARIASRLGVLIGFMLGLVLGCTMFFSRFQLPYIFTSNTASNE